MSRRHRTRAAVLAVVLLLVGLTNVGRLRSAGDDGIPTDGDDRVAVGPVPGAALHGGTPKTFTLGTPAGPLRVVTTVSDRLAGASARPPAKGRFLGVRWSLTTRTPTALGGAVPTELVVQVGARSIPVAKVLAGDGGEAVVAVPAGRLSVTATAAGRTGRGDPETGHVVSAGPSLAWRGWDMTRSLTREVSGVTWSILWATVPGLCTTYLPSKGWSAPGRAWLAIAPTFPYSLTLLAYEDSTAKLPVDSRQVRAGVQGRPASVVPDSVVTPDAKLLRDLQVIDVTAGCRVAVDVRITATAQRPATSTAPARTSRLDVSSRLDPVGQ